MSAKPMSPASWLSQNPLGDQERLYAVVSSISESAPMAALRKQASEYAARPLWYGTPYASWHAAMPWLVELPAESAFLDWCGIATANDWGWLAVSHQQPDALEALLRSLTQVRLPDGKTVFYRFWDGRYLIPALESAHADVPLKVFRRFWVNGQALSVEPVALPTEQPFPWWQVPADLHRTLCGLTPENLTHNLMLWLRDHHPELYCAIPPNNLHQRVQHFARAHLDDPDSAQALIDSLRKELAL